MNRFSSFELTIHSPVDGSIERVVVGTGTTPHEAFEAALACAPQDRLHDCSITVSRLDSGPVVEHMPAGELVAGDSTLPPLTISDEPEQESRVSAIVERISREHAAAMTPAQRAAWAYISERAASFYRSRQ